MANRKIAQSATAIAASGLLVLGLSACASETETLEVEETTGTSLLAPVEGTDAIQVPLPNAEAKKTFDDIALKSGQRFYNLGVVETYRGTSGDFSIIYDPNYTLGPAACIVFETEDGGYGVEWVFNFNPFSSFNAFNLLQNAEDINYNVTQVSDTEFIVANENTGSRKYFVENNLIVGFELADSTSGDIIGRSYVTYLVGQTEKGIIDQLVEDSSQEEIDAIFNSPEESTDESL